MRVHYEGALEHPLMIAANRANFLTVSFHYESLLIKVHRRDTRDLSS